MNKFKLDPSVCNWEFLYQTLDTRSKNEFNIKLFFTEEKCTKDEAYRHFRASNSAQHARHRVLSIRPHAGSFKWDGESRRLHESFEFDILPDDPITSD